MRVRYDPETDAFAIVLDDTEPIIESEEVLPGLVVDFNAKEQIAGLEFLGAKALLPGSVHERLRRAAESSAQSGSSTLAV
ncbi:DUF2283 domain-containing protein [Candidatus Poribacteria bacterium]|nr:DUF2283 domain-containing protein [Candidatus Poribacteria bacterium]